MNGVVSVQNVIDDDGLGLGVEAQLGDIRLYESGFGFSECIRDARV